MKKLIIGILVSIIFLYFALRGVDYNELMLELKTARFGFLFPAILVVIVIQLIRSSRWGILLSPIQKIDQRTLFPISCIGYMAIIIVPMRIGEFVRPYMVNKKKDVPFSSALATIFMERLFDVFIMVLILFISLIFVDDIPPIFISGGKILFGIAVIALVFVGFLAAKTDATIRFINPLINKFPKKYSLKIINILKSFINGFRIISNVRNITVTLFLSASIWILNAFSTFLLFYFFNLDLPFTSSLLVVVITALGISLPAAPGFVGNFQFACVAALALFDVSKTMAFTFSIVYYIIGIIVIIVLGLIFVPSANISFKEVKSMGNYKEMNES